MDIRYCLNVEGKRMEAQYSLVDLERGCIVDNLQLLKSEANILRRDLGTGIYDSWGKEVFENDTIKTSDGRKGRVVREGTGFFFDDGDSKVLLSDIEVEKVIRR